MTRGTAKCVFTSYRFAALTRHLCCQIAVTAGEGKKTSHAGSSHTLHRQVKGEQSVWGFLPPNKLPLLRLLLNREASVYRASVVNAPAYHRPPVGTGNVIGENLPYSLTPRKSGKFAHSLLNSVNIFQASGKVHLHHHLSQGTWELGP